MDRFSNRRRNKKRGIEQAKPLDEYNSLSDSAYLRAKRRLFNRN